MRGFEDLVDHKIYLAYYWKGGEKEMGWGRRHLETRQNYKEAGARSNNALGSLYICVSKGRGKRERRQKNSCSETSNTRIEY